MFSRIDNILIYECLSIITYNEYGIQNKIDYDKDKNLYYIQIKYHYKLHKIMQNDVNKINNNIILY